MKEDLNEKTPSAPSPAAVNLPASTEIVGYDLKLEDLLGKCEVPAAELGQFCPERDMSDIKRQLHQLVCYSHHAEHFTKEAAKNWLCARRDLVRIIVKNGLHFDRIVRPILLEYGEPQSRISELARIVNDPAATMAFLGGQGFQRSLDQARGIPAQQRLGMNLIKACISAGEPLNLHRDGWHIVVEQDLDPEEQLKRDLADELKHPGKPRQKGMRKVVY